LGRKSNFWEALRFIDSARGNADLAGDPLLGCIFGFYPVFEPHREEQRLFLYNDGYGGEAEVMVKG